MQWNVVSKLDCPSCGREVLIASDSKDNEKAKSLHIMPHCEWYKTSGEVDRDRIVQSGCS